MYYTQAATDIPALVQASTGQAGQWTGQKFTYPTGWVTGETADYSLSAGAFEPKNGWEWSSWCQQLRASATYMWPRTMSWTACSHIPWKRFHDWHLLSEHWGSCQPLTSQLKLQSCKTQKTNFPGPPKRTWQDNIPTSPFQTPIQHWCCLQKAVFHPWQTQHHS